MQGKIPSNSLLPTHLPPTVCALSICLMPMSR